jgi:hypothetical protein
LQLRLQRAGVILKGVFSTNFTDSGQLNTHCKDYFIGKNGRFLFRTRLLG